MRKMYRLALAVAAAVAVAAGCGDSGEREQQAEPGGAPVFVPTGDWGHFEVESGYGWTVLHCVKHDETGAEVCGDASHLYQAHDGVLCGPPDGSNKMFDLPSHRPVALDAGCRMAATNFDRWVRLH